MMMIMQMTIRNLIFKIFTAESLFHSDDPDVSLTENIILVLHELLMSCASSCASPRYPFRTSARKCIPGIEALSMLCARFAMPCRLQDLGKLFTRSGPTCSTVVNELTLEARARVAAGL